MLKTLSLTLPILIPSWRFFKEIEPSPRVQWALFPSSQASEGDWHEFRQRPLVTTPFEMFFSLFWNPAWNDTLFVVSCAERIAQQPTDHSIIEIKRRILRDVEQMRADVTGMWMQFRLVFVCRDETGLSQEIVFLSDTYPVQKQSER